MNIGRILLVLLLPGLMTSAFAGHSKTLTFVQINDLHANLVSHADLERAGHRHRRHDDGTRVVERGGLARLATMVKKERRRDPDAVVMNIGDTYHGGVEAFYTVGNAVVPAVNALGIDVGVPGNWDFAYGPSVFWLRYTDVTAQEIQNLGLPVPQGPIFRPNFPNLAANVRFMIPGHAGQTILPPTMMKTVKGVQVGFIGLTSDIVPRQNAFLGTGMNFMEGEADYRALVNQLAAGLRANGAELVVVMSELGLHKSVQLGDVIDTGSVDLIFAAHTHELVRRPVKTSSGARVVEAGNDSYLGVMKVHMRRGKVHHVRWKVKPVRQRIAEDPQVAGIVAQARAPFLADNVFMQAPTFPAQFLTTPIDRVVGKAASPLDRRRALENNFNNAYTDLVRQVSGTDVVFSPGFRYDAVIGDEFDHVTHGDISVEDVYRYFPGSFALATGTASGQRLGMLVEQGLATTFSTNAFNHFGGYLWGLSGLNVLTDLANADGARLMGMRLSDSGQPVMPSGQYSVTGCLAPVELQNPTDRLCNQPGFANVQPLIRTVQNGMPLPWTPIDLFLAAMAGGQMPDGDRRNIVDLNETPVWPQTPYIQPLGGVQ